MLFSDQNLLPYEGEVNYYDQFLDFKSQNDLLESLKTEIEWKQEGMKMYGKEILFPRLTAWFAEDGKTYKYSGLVNIPEPFFGELLSLKQSIEQFTNLKFNSALLNYYRHGQDSMGWHADNERELGINPVIASVSLGITRKFQFKHKSIPKSILNIDLAGGSLLMMKGSTQHNWLHQIPKTKVLSGERINITFRQII